MGLDTILNSPSLNSSDSALELAGNVTAAFSRIQFGMELRQAAQFAADQMRVQAGQEQAASQRSAWSADQAAKYVASDALAKAAASGGGASDPTVVNTISRIAAEGAYRAKLALYGGDDRARLLSLRAGAKDYEGALAEGQEVRAGIGGLTVAAGAFAKSQANYRDQQSRMSPPSVLSRYGGDTLLSRFGGNGPPGFNPNAALMPAGASDLFGSMKTYG